MSNDAATTYRCTTSETAALFTNDGAAGQLIVTVYATHVVVSAIQGNGDTATVLFRRETWGDFIRSMLKEA